jgi:hypothetical protein
MSQLRLIMSILSLLFSQDPQFLSQFLAAGFAADPGNHVCVYGGNCQARNPLLTGPLAPDCLVLNFS